MRNAIMFVSTKVFDCIISARPSSRHYLDIQPITEPRMHNHLMHEIHVSLSDDAKVFFDNGTITLPKHHAVLIQRGAYHRDYSEEQYKNVIILRVRFERNKHSGNRIFDALFDRIPNLSSPVCFTDSGIRKLKDFVEEYKALVLGDPKEAVWHFAACQHILALFFLEYFKYCEIEIEQGALEDTDESSRLQADIDRYINYNIDKPLTVEDLARNISYSVAQTKRLLQEYYSMSFTEKLRSQRVEIAKYRLRNSDDLIETIASDVGYKTRVGFEKLFISVTGLTPSAYRKKFRE